jgi:molecular chaperone HscB
MEDLSLCWHCGQPVRELFCPACRSLQKPPAGFFLFFGLDESLVLDESELQKRFYELSRKLHPDLYTRRDPQEREYSLEATAILNDGYRTLRDPVKRAEYVLTRHGFDMAEQRSSNVPPELLEEVFDLNMALEEIRGGDESARPELESAGTKFKAMLAEIDAELEREFANFDLQAVRGLLNRRRYIENLVRDVEKELAANTRE